MTPLALTALTIHFAGGGIGELLLTGALVDMVRTKRSYSRCEPYPLQAVDYWRRYAGTDPTLIKGAVIATVFLNILRTLQAIATLWHKVCVLSLTARGSLNR